MTLLAAVAWLIIAVIGGATASIAGFGIGSLLTPVLATRHSVSDAILAVSIPHAVATAFRCWRLRESIDWKVLRGFGITSAIGGLAGALLFLRSENIVGRILGALLVATGITGMTKWNQRVHPGSTVSVILGGASGLFGGIAGNQGGLRAAALASYKLSPAAFVATSTAIGLMVDAGRLPVYLLGSNASHLRGLAFPIAIATGGVLIGTLAGERILFRLQPDTFRKLISGLITALGAWLLVK
jgi:uncharacterized membrane protein YfcA